MIVTVVIVIMDIIHVNMDIDNLGDDKMKNQRTPIIIGIVIAIIILIGIIITSTVKPISKEKTKSEENKFATYLTNFEKSNYESTIVYSLENGNGNYSMETYYYRDEIEKYYISQDNERIVYKYNDYKNKKIYVKEPNNYTTISLENKSNHELLVRILKESKVKKKEGNTFLLKANINEIKKFMDGFHDIDNNAILYKDKNKYEIYVVINKENISSVIIKETEKDIGINYTFTNINQIESIDLPK